MTSLEANLEAIEQLKKIRTIHNGNYAPAIDLAIKALEEQDDAGYEQGWADGYAYGIGGEDE